MLPENGSDANIANQKKKGKVGEPDLEVRHASALVATTRVLCSSGSRRPRELGYWSLAFGRSLFKKLIIWGQISAKLKNINKNASP